METIIYVICILFLIALTLIVVLVMMPKDATWMYWDIKAILIIALLVEIIILITKIKYYL